MKHFFPVFLKCDNSGLCIFVQLRIQFNYTGAAVHIIKMTFFKHVCWLYLYASLYVFFSSQCRTTIIPQRCTPTTTRPQCFRGPWAGPRGRREPPVPPATQPSDPARTLRRGRSCPRKWVSDIDPPKQTLEPIYIKKKWYELICRMTRVRATIHLAGSIFDIFWSYCVSNRFS